jgi:alpha-ribazole phosphatase
VTSFLRCARHAPVALERHCHGRLDVPPGEDPHLSADRLCLTLEAPAPLAVWTSPLRRCSEVAAQLALRTGAALRIDDRLAEIDFGDWEGRSWEQIERQQPHAYRAWLACWREVAPPRGETLDAFEARVRSWLLERTRGGEIGSSALVGHAGVIRALRVLNAGATWDHALAQPVPYLEWLTLPIAGGYR